METYITINAIELASNLAEERLSLFNKSLTEEQYDLAFPNGTYNEDDSDDEVTYTEEAQHLFDKWYDEYLGMIEETAVQEVRPKNLENEH